MKPLSHIKSLVLFALRNNPFFAISLVLTLFSVGLEVLAMSYLFPISSLAAGSALSENSLPVRMLRFVHMAPTMRTLTMTFTLLFVLRIGTEIASQGLALYLSQQLKAQLSSRAFANTVSCLGIKEIEQKGIGHFITLAGDEAARSAMLILSLTQVLSSGALAAVYFIAILHYSPTVGFAVLAFLLISFLSLFGTFKKSHTLNVRQLEEARAATSLFVDALNNLRSVRSFTAEAYVAESYRAQISKYVRTAFLVEFLNVLARLGPVLVLLVIAQVWVIGMNEFGAGEFGFMATITIFLMRFFPVVGQCFNVIQRFVTEAKVSRDISEIIDLVDPHPRQGLTDLTGAVHSLGISNLEFSHNGKTPLLRGMNIEFRRGRSYAISGPSGTGKSTLTDLILNFYAPKGGTIRLNDISINDLNQSNLRQKVLVVGQQTTIFNDTVWNNIAFGTKPSERQIRHACELACINDVIDSMPKGYQTLLNYQGSNLSGGQRQRIGIARALLRKADVLIMDESTNALDKTTQEQVVKNILKEYRERIVIFVSHDPSITEIVDEVLSIGPADGNTNAKDPMADIRPTRNITAS